MDELRLVPEAEGGPAVLRVEAAVGRPVFLEPGGHRLQERRERPRRLEPCRLVGDPDLERAEARMRTHVPPDTGDLVGEAELDEALDEPLPVRVAGEDRRRGASRQEREGLGARRAQARVLTRDVRRVGRERENERQPGQDGLERRHARLRALHADVHVEAGDVLPTRGRPRIVDELPVRRALADGLLLRYRGRPGARRGENEAGLSRRLLRASAERRELRDRLRHCPVDAGVQLDD